MGWIKERQRQEFFGIVPTVAMRGGNFSGTSRVIYDPSTGQPFPGNIIPSGRIDRNALGYAKMYPDPNFSDSAGRNWFSLQGRRDDTGEQNYRIDHNISDKHRVMWRYTPEFRLNNFATSSGFEFLRQQNETPARNMTVNYNATFTPTLIMDFNWVRSHNRIKQFPPDLSGAKWGINIPQLFPDSESSYPLANLNLTAVPDRVPTIALTGYAAVAPGAPWSNYQTIYEFRDTFTWIKGAHTIKTGFNVSYEIKFEPTNTNVFGAFSFDGRFTRQPGAASGGDAFADLLLGNSSNYNETNTVAFNDNRRNSFETFIDDSWKATRKLTLNFGLRYSIFPPAHEPDARFRVFLPSKYDPAQAVTLNAAGQVQRGAGNRFNGLVDPTAYWKSSRKNFAPRFSFAYDLFGNGRTALRGGYGLFYSREILGAFILMSGNPPFSELLTIDNTQLSNPGGGSARRARQDFVGSNRADLSGFVGAGQALGVGRVASATENLRIETSKAKINRPLPLQPAKGMYYPRLEIDFERTTSPEDSLREGPAAKETSERIAQFSAGHATVTMSGSTAILRGTVYSVRESELLAQLLSFEPGIDRVKNELVIQ